MQIHQPMGPDEGQVYHLPTKHPKTYVKFFQGEPEALGATQIFVGIVNLAFGFAFAMLSGVHRHHLLNVLNYSGVLFWTGLLYIVSGSLSVAASVKPTKGKVTSSLVLNIISSVAAGIGIILISINLLFALDHYYDGPYCLYHNASGSETCEGEFYALTAVRGIVSILLILTILMFCITISTSAFGCKTVCGLSYDQINIVLYQTTSGNPLDKTGAASVTIVPLPSRGDVIIQDGAQSGHPDNISHLDQND